MITPQVVQPRNIESELIKLWESLSKEKLRACLFNLMVVNQLSPRTSYIREIVQKVSEKYPCRVLFITVDSDTKKEGLTTAISVVGSGNIACDYIDIVASQSELGKVPFVILPHLVPDLPILMLWTEDPSIDHPLFTSLSKLAHRIIFDSESAASLLAFSQKVLSIKKSTDTADLNWARIEGWRDLITSLFHSGRDPNQIQYMHITYNARETEVFCHTKVQSFYLLAWVASCLGWKLQQASQACDFTFEGRSAKLEKTEWEELGSGMITAVYIETEDGVSFDMSRIHCEPHHVMIKTSSKEKCEMPYPFVLGKTATGQSLVKEIITKGTSTHYLNTLTAILALDRGGIC